MFGWRRSAPKGAPWLLPPRPSAQRATELLSRKVHGAYRRLTCKTGNGARPLPVPGVNPRGA
ncbi:hypothetical protein SZ55_4484 [Pseudomonas sp. FeS53a]|nr:hypothetical protein SZ55_4484 [Pseudomonas sp. FeS53a]